MSNTKKGILEILAVVLVVFTVVFLLNAYNKGDIGNKAEKVAKSFSEQIEGTWYGKGEISSVTFKPEGQTTLGILGIQVNGEYIDIYDIENDAHTLELKYKTIAGISVDRKFKATLDEENDKLTLVDTQLSKVELVLTRSKDETATSTKNLVPEKTSAVKTQPESTKKTADNSKDKNLEALKNSLVGEWTDTNGTNSGYTFRDDSTVTITLLGVSSEGKYTLTVDEETGRPLIRITYAKVGISNINNGYFVTVANGVLTLVQRGAEKISFTYNKV